jgi:hypothetical protein
MKRANCVWAGICLSVLMTMGAQPAAAQAQCGRSQDQAVECFVANAVSTKLTTPRYGMTMSQFETYGVAVSKIMQSDQAYLVLFSTASAIGDALPPTNSSGSANLAAQDLAVEQIVQAAVTNGIVVAPAETTSQHLQYFTLDLVNMMNSAGGMLQIMAPGTMLRVVDSYIVTGSVAGQPSWTKINASISSAVTSLVTAGTLKLPANVTFNQVSAYLQSVAQAIYSYKQSTGRLTL